MGYQGRFLHSGSWRRPASTETIQLFESEGVLTKKLKKQGRFFPVSNKASDVLRRHLLVPIAAIWSDAFGPCGTRAIHPRQCECIYWCETLRREHLQADTCDQHDNGWTISTLAAWNDRRRLCLARTFGHAIVPSAAGPRAHPNHGSLVDGITRHHPPRCEDRSGGGKPETGLVRRGSLD